MKSKRRPMKPKATRSPLTRIHPEYPSYFEDGPLRDAAYNGWGVLYSDDPSLPRVRPEGETGPVYCPNSAVWARDHKHPKVTALQHDWCWLNKSAHRNGWCEGILALVVKEGRVYCYNPRGGVNFTTALGTAVYFDNLQRVLARNPDAIYDHRDFGEVE